MATRRKNPRERQIQRERMLRIPQAGEPSPFQRPNSPLTGADYFVLDEQTESEPPAPATVVEVIFEPETSIVEVTFEPESAIRRAVVRPPGYWKMRDGRFLAIPDMENSHLENTILMLERNSLTRGRRLDPTRPGSYRELLEERNRRNILREEQQVRDGLGEMTAAGRNLFRLMVDAPQPVRNRPPFWNIDREWISGVLYQSAQEEASHPSTIEEGRPVRRIKS